MSSSDGDRHPISLKVMRVSKPTLAAHWEPFFSSSPSLSTLPTSHVLSLQGPTPLSGHPKTLRDLSHAGPLLTLPSVFGAIQLGEIFSCSLAIHNETAQDVNAVTMKVEIQTATDRVTLAEIGGSDFQLSVNETAETVVTQEIREIGQHVLACTLEYCTSGNLATVTPITYMDESNVKSFRKFYKFSVTNPLSVKTKVHIPRNPTACLSSLEKKKLFLEVHVQNLSRVPLWFENVLLEPVENWVVESGSLISSPHHTKSLSLSQDRGLSGNKTIMQPQDVYQYIYTLTPKTLRKMHITFAPGSIVPLGRLDISWRSSMGEPGRLLTSVLSRRIPSPNLPSQVIKPTPSALTHPFTSPSRPHSPSLTSQQQLPRQISPLTLIPVSQTFATSQSQLAPSPSSHRLSSDQDEFGQIWASRANGSETLCVSEKQCAEDFVVVDAAVKMPNEVHVEEIFSLHFSLTLSVKLHGKSDSALSLNQIRCLVLAVQHTSPIEKDMCITELMNGDPRFWRPLMSDSKRNEYTVDCPRTTSIDDIEANEFLVTFEPPPDQNSNSNLSGPTTKSLQHTSNSDMEPLQLYESEAKPTAEESNKGDGARKSECITLAPSPYVPLSSDVQEIEAKQRGKVRLNGTSLTNLPPMIFNPPKTQSNERTEVNINFCASYMPSARGFAKIGGMRVWLIHDTILNIKNTSDDGTSFRYDNGNSNKIVLLKEYSSAGEVLII